MSQLDQYLKAVIAASSVQAAAATAFFADVAYAQLHRLKDMRGCKPETPDTTLNFGKRL